MTGKEDMPIPQSEEEFKARLTPEQYAVLRQRGTEAPFSGALLSVKEDGKYRCAACGNALFNSDAKYDSGTGWPSFHSAIPGSVEFLPDTSEGMSRTEVKCARCHSHLGHVFDDGPSEGKRYCMNSVCLDFEKDAGQSQK
jgi:peptide-methionine (R)-S-oxide reductase